MTDEERFEQVVNKIKDEEALTQEDALFLLGLIARLDGNLSITNMLFQTALQDADSLAKRVAKGTLSRSGRTDTKIKRSIDNLVRQEMSVYYADLDYSAQQYSQILEETRARVAQEQEAATVQEDTKEETS